MSKPLILAVETSGRLGSVAIAQGQELLGEKQFSGPMRHSAEIFPDIVSLLEQFNKKPADTKSSESPQGIEHVYISIGPGSFTGLRIAVTIAKSMALARQFADMQIGEVSPAESNSARRTKIVAVDTLDCIAANVIDLPEISRLAVILDAKRGQFFIAVYEKTSDSIWIKTTSDCLMTAEEFLTRFTDKPIVLTGEGLVFYKDKFLHPAVKILDEKYWNPSAASIHKIGWQKAIAAEFTDPVSLVPNYIRGPDVKIKQL
jgi:tRNA threonylcarbamoyladenosine biosynthesis protein TsaB